MRSHLRAASVLAASIVTLTIGSNDLANAASLTVDGAAKFTLSTFADAFPTTGVCCGPLGIAFPGGGQVMVTDYPGNVRVFPTDADGQHASSVPVAQNYGFSNAVGLSMSGGRIFMTQQGFNSVVELNPSGTFNQSIATGIAFATGIATNPITGNLYVSAPNAGLIYEINPTTKAIISSVAVSGADGLTVNAAGTVLYVAVNNSITHAIIGFDTTLTHAIVFDSGFIAGTPDGTAIGGSGALAGKIYVNTNGGQLIEIDLATKVQTVIMDGGSRGDFVNVDPYNGTLLLTQTDRILRLTPFDGGFEGTTTPVPAALPLFATGLAGLGFVAYRRRKRAA